MYVRKSYYVHYM